MKEEKKKKNPGRLESSKLSKGKSHLRDLVVKHSFLIIVRPCHCKDGNFCYLLETTKEHFENLNGSFVRYTEGILQARKLMTVFGNKAPV